RTFNNAANMEAIKQEFSVAYQYSVFFTEHLFDTNNKLLFNVLTDLTSTSSSKTFFVIDEGVVQHHPELPQKIRQYFNQHPSLPALCADPLLIPGGEQCKNDETFCQRILEAVNRYGIDRHSFVIAIGGGALLDLAGYAAAIAHRGCAISGSLLPCCRRTIRAWVSRTGSMPSGKRIFWEHSFRRSRCSMILTSCARCISGTGVRGLPRRLRWP